MSLAVPAIRPSTHLVVDVVAADGVRVHEVAAALGGARRALRDVGVVFGAPVVAELVRRHQIRLAGDHTLPVVVPRAAQARVQVERVAVLEVLRRANPAHRVPTRRPHIRQPQNAPLELQIGEQVRQTEVLVTVFAREHLEQIADVPLLPDHVVMGLAATDSGRLRVHHDLLYDESHPSEPLLVLRTSQPSDSLHPEKRRENTDRSVLPHGVVVNLVHAVNQADLWREEAALSLRNGR